MEAHYETDALHERIVRTADEARRTDIRAYETATRDQVEAELLAVTSRLQRDAIALCDEVCARFDVDLQPLGGHPEDELVGTSSGLFHLRIDSMVADQCVCDVAFFGAAELRQRLTALPTDTWDLVEECGSTLRRVYKTLSAIEPLLAEQLGHEPRLSFESELALSIETRRQYGRLRRAVLAHDAPRDLEGLQTGMRRIGTVIAMLVGRDVYPSLRGSDRKQIRALQTRIIAWLRRPSETEGMRLWQDIVGFVRLLSAVNRRQELLRHDTRLLEALTNGNRLEPRMHEVRALRGLDDELDAELEGSDPSEARLAAILDRLATDYLPSRRPSMEVAW